MTADLTRDQALKQMALAIYCAYRSDYTPGDATRAWDDLNKSPLRDEIEHDAAAALTVLWPVVEGLRAERDEARENAEDDERLIRRQGDLLTGVANALRGDPPPMVAWGHSALPDLAFRVKVSMEEARAEVDRLTAELAHAHTVIARHVEPRRGPDCTPGAPLTAEQGAPRVPGRDGGERA